MKRVLYSVSLLSLATGILVVTLFSSSRASFYVKTSPVVLPGASANVPNIGHSIAAVSRPHQSFIDRIVEKAVAPIVFAGEGSGEMLLESAGSRMSLSYEAFMGGDFEEAILFVAKSQGYLLRSSEGLTGSSDDFVVAVGQAAGDHRTLLEYYLATGPEDMKPHVVRNIDINQIVSDRAAAELATRGIDHF